ncbi:MAG: DMT family transporter [Pseudomonadales bacterium]|nr:DMT family transporter [Pseudomonadales bacterium]
MTEVSLLFAKPFICRGKQHPLSAKYFIQLLILAAIWGSSFLFTRLSVPELGPIPLTALRSGIAALVLLPILFLSAQAPIFLRHWQHLLIVGMISTALPFSFITVTTLYTSAGFASILNAMTPIFSGLFAWLWLKEQLSVMAMIGIALGFIGVLIMVTDTRTISADFLLLPVLTGLAATLCYGLTGNYSRKFLTGVPPVTIATGCQFFSALALSPIAWLLWPEQSISTSSWFSALVLGVLCTGIAFILFFHLLAQVGVARTMVVTYMVPVFAMLWGYLYLQENVTPKMLAGALFILTGIALTTGILRRRKKPRLQPGA